MTDDRLLEAAQMRLRDRCHCGEDGYDDCQFFARAVEAMVKESHAHDRCDDAATVAAHYIVLAGTRAAFGGEHD